MFPIELLQPATIYSKLFGMASFSASNDGCRISKFWKCYSYMIILLIICVNAVEFRSFINFISFLSLENFLISSEFLVVITNCIIGPILLLKNSQGICETINKIHRFNVLKYISHDDLKMSYNFYLFMFLACCFVSVTLILTEIFFCLYDLRQNVFFTVNYTLSVVLRTNIIVILLLQFVMLIFLIRLCFVWLNRKMMALLSIEKSKMKKINKKKIIFEIKKIALVHSNLKDLSEKIDRYYVTGNCFLCIIVIFEWIRILKFFHSIYTSTGGSILKTFYTSAALIAAVSVCSFTSKKVWVECDIYENKFDFHWIIHLKNCNASWRCETAVQNNLFFFNSMIAFSF